MENDKKNIIDIISGKWVFSAFFMLIFMGANLLWSKAFLSQPQLTIPLLNIVLISSDTGMGLFKAAYYILTALGSFGLAYLIHGAFISRVIEEESEAVIITEEEVIKSKWPTTQGLSLVIGLKHNKNDVSLVRKPEYLIIPEKGLYQNTIAFGAIGSGKTSCLMLPAVKQLLFHDCYNPHKKAGGLILDIKGNFYKEVLEFARLCGREKDIIVISLDGDIYYNPLHKPDMEPMDLAARSRHVLELFSGNATKEKFWDNKAQSMISESIRLLRLTSGYVTLADIHRIVSDDNFLYSKLEELDALEGSISDFEYTICKNYFVGEFDSKAESTIAIIKACVTEMTQFFVSSKNIYNRFCPSEEALNFKGFSQVINEGKIVIFAINGGEHPQVSKTISAYLKLDFQSEARQRTNNDRAVLAQQRPVFFIADEYQEFFTSNDSSFYGLSRESKVVAIVATQSVSSLLNAIGKKEAVDTLLQNLINKICLRTDDKNTIDVMQFLTGKHEVEKISRNITESAKDSKRSKVFGKLASDKSSVSESVTVNTAKEPIYEERMFTQGLTVNKAIAYTANDNGINEPSVIHLMPYYEEPISNLYPDGIHEMLKLTDSEAEYLKIV